MKELNLLGRFFICIAFVKIGCGLIKIVIDRKSSNAEQE